jgi:hypothetical protein
MTWEHWFDTILVGRIKASKPSEFNDPFDCVGTIEGRLSENAAGEFADKSCEKYIPPDVDVAERGLIKRLIKCRAEELVAEAFAKKKHLDDIFRIVCFSAVDGISDNADLLMWSHYADKARGVRIAIDIPETNEAYVIERIQYSDKMPVYHLQDESSFLNGHQWNLALRRFVCTKSLAWEYEQEVRLVLGVSDAKADMCSVKGVDFLNVPRSWFKSVTFGSEVDWQIAVHHSLMLRLAGCSEIKFFKAIRNRKSYALDYKEIDVCQAGSNNVMQETRRM